MRELEGFSRYLIFENGSIFDKKMDRVLSTHRDKDGYIRASLKSDAGKWKTMMVHRFVALTYLSNPDNKPCVNHIDGNKENNRVYNLEWVTVKENNVHAYATGLKKASKGMNHYSTNLTESDVKYILINNDSIDKEILMSKFDISKGALYNIINRRTWKHVKIGG